MVRFMILRTRGAILSVNSVRPGWECGRIVRRGPAGAISRAVDSADRACGRDCPAPRHGAAVEDIGSVLLAEIGLLPSLPTTGRIGAAVSSASSFRTKRSALFLPWKPTPRD
jgi:hypothetical protein